MYNLYHIKTYSKSMQELIFKKFIISRNLSSSSQRLYKAALTDYSQFNKMSLQELIDEADQEEENNIRAKKRKIKERLINYRIHKIETKTPYNTLNSYFSCVKTFYRHNEIEIPYMPHANIKKEFHERYSDIPTKKDIEQVLNSTKNLQHKAIILFMSSSGSAAAETLSLTIQNFIKATNEYHHSYDIQNVIKDLERRKDVVPIFEMVRKKTDYPYYTCCSPEAVQSIITYLKTRSNLKNEDKLFEIKHSRSIALAFIRLNNINQFGKVGHGNFFHSHALRKFHATTIGNRDLVNALQGRKPDNTTGAYFKDNPNRLKEEYVKVLPKITIGKTETFNLKSKEYLKLERENQSKTDEINALKESDKAKTDELIAVRKEQAELRKMVGDLLNKVED